MLAKRGVDSLEKLSKQQADEILVNLRQKMTAKKVDLDKQLAAAEKANPTSAATGSHAAPAATAGKTDAQPATESLSEPEQAFVKAMKSHDWYYQMSDDGTGYQRGPASENRMHAAAMAIPETRRIELWAEHSPKWRGGVLQFKCPGVSPKSTPTGNGSSNSGPASATVGVEPGAIPERPDQVGSILPDDEKRILAYCRKLMLGDADLARILAKRMQGNPPHPTRCVADLTYNHAVEILENLKAALTKRFPDQAPF
jgi:hypothetical protein